jgi:ketosteroid isomerase-like protein
VTAREELRAFNERFSEALAANDAVAIAAAYTNDARLLFHGTPLIQGSEAIANVFAAPAQITFESGDIWEAGNIVVDVGTYRSPAGTGKYVVVYERQPDGSLRMAVDAANADSAG